MNFLDQANSFCRRLWRDESGVVLALTVVVFLTLFVIACSVYAVGENIRQRIELQNAADAAAYSAAVVQADALSRVAALNKAMAWTYVQMCRRQMDYIIRKWLQRVSDVYLSDMQQRESEYQSLQSGISHCDGYRQKVFWIGEQGHQQQVRINMEDNQWYSIGFIQQIAYDVPLEGVRNAIDKDRTAVAEMGNDETVILTRLPDKIKETVEYILRADVHDTFNDAVTFGGSGDIRYALLQSVDPKADYCDLYDNEKLFLQAANAQSSDMGEGHDTWFPGPLSGEKWSRSRQYDQWGKQGTGQWLVAEWKSFVEGYYAWSLRWNKVCGSYYTQWKTDPVSRQQMYWGKNGGIKAQDVYDGYFATQEIQPLRLKPEFFGRAGALVIAVARRANNPLSFMAANPSQLGLLGFFSADQNNRYAWAATASRGGYTDGVAGEYNPSAKSLKYGDWITTTQNLSQPEWDAVLVPLHTAWAAQGGSGATILAELWTTAEWRSLYGTGQTVNGLSSVASGAAPAGLAGAISFSDESVVLH